MIAFHSISNHLTAIYTGDLLSRQPRKGCWDAAGSRRLRSREHAVRRGQGSWDGKNTPGGLRGRGAGCSWRGTEVHLCSGGYCCAGLDPRTSAEMQRQQFRQCLGGASQQNEPSKNIGGSDSFFSGGFIFGSTRTCCRFGSPKFYTVLQYHVLSFTIKDDNQKLPKMAQFRCSEHACRMGRCRWHFCPRKFVFSLTKTQRGKRFQPMEVEQRKTYIVRAKYADKQFASCSFEQKLRKST